MSSNQSVEQALASTQRQLFLRFMTILLSCLVLIEIVVGVLFFYDLYKTEKKILNSLSIEYQRIIKFESDEKLIHVLSGNPQRLIDNNIAAFSVTPSESVLFIAGDANLPADLNLNYYLPNDKWWFTAFIMEPYIALKMQGNAQDFVLLLDNKARYPSVVRQWSMTFFALIILVIFTSVFIRRLIKNTMSPLVILGEQLDKLSAGSLDSFSAYRERDHNNGLDAINQSVHLAISRLHQVIVTMDTTVDAIAHDIRTPLARITLASESALLGFHQHKEKAEMEMANALSDCAEHAEQASNMLKALMKLNDELTEKRQIQCVPTDINAVISRVAHWYEGIAEEKNITVSCVTPAGMIIDSDADKLTQVLVNLVDNALKYTDAGGEIMLTSSMQQDGRIQIQVIDSGVGIAREHQELVFKRLYRVDPSRSNTDGYGLGLSLALAMLSNIGGTLSLESELGKGSVFTIKLEVIMDDSKIYRAVNGS
ncbi:cell wall metabolism sensor histidine kinase WalK [Moritella sp. F3]|uniref:sensor histidine kinase n=1 Tax=Moritella sp. F3 TaxID=2718882 RepID=UPI001A277FFF|nr:HAMP domain-containing sensor histidine kinase [Moritella sp. F3]GIC75583.1 hypothetical protein FMO001_03100 [Moritella sp. F1]GIC80728.1 hypothetical protein FMO003_10090 [Moritella sp. F3]